MIKTKIFPGLTLFGFLFISCSPTMKNQTNVGPGGSGGTSGVDESNNLIKSSTEHQYGFDPTDPRNPYMSLESLREGIFRFKLQGPGGNFSQIKVVSTDPDFLAINPITETFPVNQEEQVVRVNSVFAIPTGIGKVVKVDLVRKGAEDDIIGSLNVSIFQKESRSIKFVRVMDNSNQNTDPGPNPPMPDVQNFLNGVYKQAVFEVGTPALSQISANYESQFSDGRNGLVDYFPGSGGPGHEMQAVLNALDNPFDDRASIGFIKGFRFRWVPDRNAAVGATEIFLNSTIGISAGQTLTVGASNVDLTVSRVDQASDKIVLEDPLAAPITTGDYLFLDNPVGGLAFVATNAALAASLSGCDFLRTVAHELAHLEKYGALSDIENDKNLMFEACRSLDVGLFHQVTKPDRTKENQWELMHTR